MITRSETESVIKKLPANKSPGRDGCTGELILPTIQRTYTDPFQTLPKDWRGGNTPKDILWSHHHPDTKTKQRYHQKRKLQASISDGYRCRKSQQNISKPNPTIHKKDHTPRPSGIHPKFTRIVQHSKYINVTHHINKRTDKNHMIILTAAEKAFDKIQHPFMITTLTKVGTEGTYLNIIKAIYDKPTANIILNSEKLKAFVLKFTTRMPTVTTSVQHSIRSPSHSNQTIKSNKRYTNWKGRGKIIIISRWHNTIYGKS